jgi:hypothetical protein
MKDIEYKNLDTAYDKLIVFDLLSNEERENLKITSSLESYFTTNSKPIEVHLLNNKKELHDKFAEIEERAKEGEKFLFHFVGHGNSDGIGFKHTQELVEWKELSSDLSKINLASGNTLVLNLTSCFGLNGIKTVNPFHEDTPFFGLIGFTETLNSKIAKQANEIFYREFFKGISINEILKILKKETSNDNFHCISSQGYSEMKKANK